MSVLFLWHCFTSSSTTVYLCVYDHILAQQAHEVAGCVGVEAERGSDDVGGSMSPFLVVILHPIQHCMSYSGLCMDHLTYRDKMERSRKKKSFLFTLYHHRYLNLHACLFFIATHLASWQQQSCLQQKYWIHLPDRLGSGPAITSGFIHLSVTYRDLHTVQTGY